MADNLNWVLSTFIDIDYFTCAYTSECLMLAKLFETS